MIDEIKKQKEDTDKLVKTLDEAQVKLTKMRKEFKEIVGIDEPKEYPRQCPEKYPAQAQVFTSHDSKIDAIMYLAKKLYNTVSEFTWPPGSNSMKLSYLQKAEQIINGHNSGLNRYF